MAAAEYFIFLLIIPFFFFAFAVLTNLYREYRRYTFELKPNCLLTRNPVVFISGPRSIFYFRKYWNAYPEILAEHGYEVFTLHLPWRGQARWTRMKYFLNQQTTMTKKYHFVCDDYSSLELRDLLEHSSSVASLTIIKNKREFGPPSRKASAFLSWSYKLHSWIEPSSSLPTAEDLGVQFPTSTAWLLQKMQENGEQDYLV